MKLDLGKSKDEERSVYIQGLSWFAAFWSYSVNHSIAWAIFHWFCGPAYIAYRFVHSYPALFK